MSRPIVSSTSEWAEHPELAGFYSRHRSRSEDLYPSERRFLPWLARQAATGLDVGCAAGGFLNMWRQYNPAVSYTGVDLSASLIDAARRRHPDATFLHGDCPAGLLLPDRAATVVQALGWLHWEPRYGAALRELWRLTDRYLFFDVRLTDGSDQVLTGRQRMVLLNAWDGRTTTPYLIVPWPQMASLLIACHPDTLLGYGYWGPPADTVTGVPGRVCFATFVMEKTPAAAARRRRPQVCLDLPFAWPEALSGLVNAIHGTQLDTLLSGAATVTG